MGLNESTERKGLFLGVPLNSPQGVNLLPFSSENIGGIGVDICDVPRIKEVIVRNPLYTKLTFTPEEIAYCQQTNGDFQAQRYTARFAAKEAVAKALGGIPYSFMDICILRDEDGRPQVELRGRAKEYAQKKGVSTVFLSISHIKDAAIAFSIAVRHPSS